MKVPLLKRISDYEVEDFESYHSRWPNELEHIPEDIIKSWAYHHNEFVIENSNIYNLSKWSFSKSNFNNENILEIKHYSGELEHMDNNGDTLMKHGMPGYDTAEYMLCHGTFPCPIIVAHNAGKFKHQKSIGNETMLEPYHLIEGHRRLGFLRGMIKHKYPKLQKEHEVWLVTINT